MCVCLGGDFHPENLLTCPQLFVYAFFTFKQIGHLPPHLLEVDLLESYVPWAHLFVQISLLFFHVALSASNPPFAELSIDPTSSHKINLISCEICTDPPNQLHSKAIGNYLLGESCQSSLSPGMPTPSFRTKNVDKFHVKI